MAPENLTDGQRGLLKDEAPAPSPAQQQATELAGFEASSFWNLLDERQRALVRQPSRHPNLAGVDYPLGVGQLARLVGATPDKVRHWNNSGLLPARRSSGRHREFYEAAGVRAFYLNDLGRAGITVLRDLARGEGAPLLLGISAALHGRASSASDSDRDLIRRAAADLEQVGNNALAARPAVRTISTKLRRRSARARAPR